MDKNAIGEKVMSELVAQACRQLQARAHELMTQADALVHKHFDTLPPMAIRDIGLARQSLAETCYYIGRACGDFLDDHSDVCHCDACKKLTLP